MSRAYPNQTALAAASADAAASPSAQQQPDPLLAAPAQQTPTPSDTSASTVASSLPSPAPATAAAAAATPAPENVSNGDNTDTNPDVNTTTTANINATTTTNSDNASPDDSSPAFYRIKWTLNAAAQSVPICMQSRNGPCPLLALANASILRNDISLAPGTTRISEQHLMTLLAEFVSSRPRPAALPRSTTTPSDAARDDAAGRADEITVADAAQGDVDDTAGAMHDVAVSDFLDLLPRLTSGMNVNPRFAGPLDFEFTRELSAFDVFPNLRLVHGWLVDPQDSRLLVALGQLSYNQLIDELVRTEPAGVSESAAASAPPADAFDAAVDATWSFDRDDGAAPDADADADAVRADEGADEDAVEPGDSTVTANIRELRPAVVEFLESNPTQMTIYGLAELHGVLRADETAILFRNSHFHVVRKHEGELYALVTDEGFLDELNTVWEKLVDVNGDSMFYNGAFQRIAADGSVVGASPGFGARPTQPATGTRRTGAAAAAAAAASGGAGGSNGRSGLGIWDTAGGSQQAGQRKQAQTAQAHQAQQQSRKKKGGKCTLQ